VFFFFFFDCFSVSLIPMGKGLDYGKKGGGRKERRGRERGKENCHKR